MQWAMLQEWELSVFKPLGRQHARQISSWDGGLHCHELAQLSQRLLGLLSDMH